MAVSAAFRDYVLEQLNRLVPTTARAMFGGAGLYSGGLIFGLLDDDTLYFKVDEANRAAFEAAGCAPFRPFGPDTKPMGYYEVPADAVDDPEALRPWLEGALAAARSAKSKPRGRGKGKPEAEPLLRRFRAGDLAGVIAVFRSAVRGTGPTAYDAGQVAVWARFPEDRAAFGAALARGVTIVAERGGTIVAFGQLYPEDHIEYLYTDARYNRTGLGSAIHARLEDSARAAGTRRLTTKASLISRSFFEKAGFTVTKEEEIERGGVRFRRFRMAKRLEPRPAPVRARRAVPAVIAPETARTVTVSRTIAAPLARLFEVWHSAAQRRLWLHVAGVSTRRAVARKSLRLNWNDDGSSVLVTFETIVSGRCVVTVRHEGIEGEARAAELEALWTESLNRLRRRLER